VARCVQIYGHLDIQIAFQHRVNGQIITMAT
jgi:hypothetical protein